MHNATFPAFLQDSKQTQKATQVNHLFKAQTNKHHHQITKLSHSINAIGPAPHRGGRKSQSQSTNKHTKTEKPDTHCIMLQWTTQWLLKAATSVRRSHTTFENFRILRT
jgi:hypothetical protein